MCGRTIPLQRELLFLTPGISHPLLVQAGGLDFIIPVYSTALARGQWGAAPVGAAAARHVLSRSNLDLCSAQQCGYGTCAGGLEQVQPCCWGLSLVYLAHGAPFLQARWLWMLVSGKVLFAGGRVAANPCQKHREYGVRLHQHAALPIARWQGAILPAWHPMHAIA